MNKIFKVVIGAFLFIIINSFTKIYAEIPKDTVIIGDKAYALSYINKNIFNTDFKLQINKQIINSKNKKIYYIDNASGKITNIFDKLKTGISNDEITKLPEITYLDSEGNQNLYASGNGVQIISDGTKQWFPYTSSWNDVPNTKSALDISSFLDAPAGKHGFVKANGDHFVFEDGTRAKFWGINFTAGYCFPTHEEAEILAEQLAKSGFNAVRFHYMDTDYAIIDSKTKKISSIKLEKLDYFIYQLKLRGIYSDLNLHVARDFSDSGIPKVPTSSKSVALFDNDVIALEKDYAKQLLNHVNPYTGNSYSNEPSICFVEIVNEDSLFSSWINGRLFTDTIPDVITDIYSSYNLSAYYVDELDKKWNEYLKDKYKTQENLGNAWATSSLNENNLIANSGFENEIEKPWILEKLSGATANLVRDSYDKVNGSYSAKVDITNIGSAGDYLIQLKQNGIHLEKDKKYKVEFYAKADEERNISVCCYRDISPYTNYGFYRNVPLTNQWQKYTYYFTAPETTDDKVRLTFNLASSTGKVWFDDVKLAQYAGEGVLGGESLDNNNITRVKWSDINKVVVAKANDSIDFYYLLEKGFYKDMITYIHNNLGVKVPLNTTNSYFGQPDLLVQQEGDYIDTHIYWDHPIFIQKAGDVNNFRAKNLSLIRDSFSNKNSMGDGCLDRIALSATKGKPIVISEWNYSYPNDYEYEGPNIFTAYMCLQDVDAAFAYSYSAIQTSNIFYPKDNNGYITDWFSLMNNSGKKAQLMQNAIAFYRGDIKPAQKEIVQNYNNDFAKNSYLYGQSIDILGDKNRLPFAAFYDYKIRKQFNQASTYSINDLLTPTEVAKLQNEKIHVSDTGEIKLDGSVVNKEYLSVNTDKYQSISGFIANTEMSLKNLTAKVNGDCTIGLISLDDNNISNSNRMLLTVVAQQKNTNQVKNKLNGLDSWGIAPALMQMVRGNISIEQDYKGGRTYKVYALDKNGERVVEKNIIVKLDKVNNKALLQFEIGDATLYYEIVSQDIKD